MLYGYGDDRNPYTETVDFLEDLVMEFLVEMTHSAMDIGRTGRVQVIVVHYSLPLLIPKMCIFSNKTLICFPILLIKSQKSWF